MQLYLMIDDFQMNIYKHKFLSRIGMMHMIAANLCVWLNVLILETSHEIVGKHHGGDDDDNVTDHGHHGFDALNRTMSGFHDDNYGNI